MDIVVVESPAKAKTIGKYLGSNFKVIASLGHIRDLPSKNGSVVPDEDFKMIYEVSSPQAKKFLQEMKKACKNANSILLATDPDREGEAISWHVMSALLENKAISDSFPVKRIVFNEITKKAVREALDNPRDVDMDLVNAQQARRALDYLVGFNISPILWKKLPGSKSAGRVQSVSLRLICDREAEIEKFQKKEYWTIDATLLNKDKIKFPATLSLLDGTKLKKFDINNKDLALDIVSKIKSKSFNVSDIIKKQSKRNPYPPFITSTLQQESSRKLGFSSKKTMQVAQKLYEGIDISGETIGLITYMRTDGTYMADEAISSMREMIKSKYGEEYCNKSPRKFQSKSKNSQEAHEAIRPTDITNTPDKLKSFLSSDQYKLYQLIWKRTIACQMSQAILDQVSAIISSSDNKDAFSANGSMISFDGFYKAYKEDVDDPKSEGESKMLPHLKEGDDIGIDKVDGVQHFTQPPPRYTEASLIKKMEELGIGRPSTYSSIISVLQDRDYVTLSSKRFIPEWRGRIVTSFLYLFFEKYVEYDFTSSLEEDLDRIASGELTWKDVLSMFWKDFSSNVKDISEYDVKDIMTSLNSALEYSLFYDCDNNDVEKKCSQCEKGELSLKLGKFGAFLGCSNYPECKFIKDIDSAKKNVNQDSNSPDSPVEQEEYPKVLGIHPSEQLEVSLKKGPYGIYVQMGDSNTDFVKRSSLPPSVEPSVMSLDLAVLVLSLPRTLGKHPTSKKDVKAGLGKFGPYIVHDSQYVSLKQPDDVLLIELERAIQLIDLKSSSTKGKKTKEPLKSLGETEEYGKIDIFDGLYGPYIKSSKKAKNVSLPKGQGVEDITLDQAIDLLDKKNKKK